MKPNNSFHSPQPSENKRDSRCKTGSCSGDYKVTPAIRQQNELPETVNPYNQETPSTDRDKDKIEYRAVPNSINEAAKETDNDISDSEAATDQSESIPPCLGGDCDLSNIHDILNDCTGSGCPPKNDEWYQKFLGIAKPDHSYFDRNWQHDQNYRKNYIKSLKTPPQIHKRNLFLKTKTDLETLSHDMKIKHSEFPSVNRKSFKKKPSQSKFDINSRIKKGIDKSKEKTNDETLISDAPKCRDDLCIDSEEIDEDFDRLVPDEKDQDMEFMCPAGYAKETRGEVTFCKPMQGLVKTEHVSERNCEEGEQLIRTNGREFCVPAKPKSFSRTMCSKGQVAIPTDDGIKCSDALPSATFNCTDGKIPKETITGRFCPDGSVPMRTPSGLYACADGRVPLDTRSTICVSPDSKNDKAKTIDNSCAQDQVAIQTSTGFVCVDKVEPRPMCGSGTTPQIRNGRLECDLDLECSPEQVAVETETGKVCWTLTSSQAVPIETPVTSEPPCPYGLVPLQTSVGRICQYLPPHGKPNDVNNCPEGELPKTEDGKTECVKDQQMEHVKCPADQTRIKTDRGYMCAYEISKQSNCPTGFYDKHGECINECPEGIDGSNDWPGKQCVPKMKACPFGTIMIDGKCHDINKNSLCPVGQDLVKTADGFDCIYQQQKDPGQGSKLTSCDTGQILSQAMRMFYCEAHTVPPSEEIECRFGEVFVKIGGGYACITEQEAALQCTEQQVLVKLPNGFTCASMKVVTSRKHKMPQCNNKEVQFTDVNGYQVCISLDMASGHCGEGYKAMKKGQEFVCRKHKLDLHCPQGYVLSFDGEKPACVSEIDLDCFPLGRQLTRECLQKLSTSQTSPCENGYYLEESGGTFQCSLNDLCENQDDAGVRPCDIDPQVLLVGCNPECANGGTCNNGRCLCPTGVTGTACNEDVNECQSLQSNVCDYQCENTFGSYQCSCPAGMTLQTDRRTCTAPYCSPDCLNGGSCIGGQCRCPRGFKGHFCQADVDECELYGDRLCQHVCRNTYGRYSCICPHGTRLNADGRTCTNTTCIPVCRNDGDCVDNRCVCAAGFYGRVCQLDINECYQYQPCSHSCVNLRGSYRCSCPRGLVLQPDGHTCL